MFRMCSTSSWGKISNTWIWICTGKKLVDFTKRCLTITALTTWYIQSLAVKLVSRDVQTEREGMCVSGRECLIHSFTSIPWWRLNETPSWIFTGTLKGQALMRGTVRDSKHLNNDVPCHALVALSIHDALLNSFERILPHNEVTVSA